MQDFLLEVGKNRAARRVLERLGVPIPLPVELARESGAFSQHPLSHLELTILGDGRAREPIKHAVTAMGAILVTEGGHALVVDATELREAGALTTIHSQLQPALLRAKRLQRLVIVGLDANLLKDPEHAATQAALEGLVRSLAKELGRKGATANLILLEPALASQSQLGAILGAPLGFLLSRRSAFISGQTLPLHLPDGPVDASLGWTKAALTGKLALVTGAARGIGTAIATQLAAEGARLWLVDHPSQAGELDRVAHILNAKAQTVDLAADDAAEVIAAAVAADAQFGKLDILVNNAGITRDKTFARMTHSQWEDTITVNLRATIALSQAFSRPKKAQPLLQEGGRIVCLSSISGLAGNAGQCNYAAAKAGIVAYVRTLAKELAAQHITVNALAPGFIDTPMTQAMPPTMREFARRFNALKQAGLPSDIGDAAAFLASPAACGISGTTLRICGQNLIGR